VSLYSESLWAGRSWDEIQIGARFSTPIQTSPGAHPVPYTIGTRSFLAVKQPECGVDHLCVCVGVGACAHARVCSAVAGGWELHTPYPSSSPFRIIIPLVYTYILHMVNLLVHSVTCLFNTNVLCLLQVEV
jgi:hypothetical protein